MSYTALRDDVIREVPDVPHLAAQDGDFHAAVVIKVHMQRRDREIMVVMRRVCQSAGKVARLMVIDIDDRPQAVGVPAL